ncbi:unnamed protein product [Linum tenue]|uniref:Uncharacterized protein n=1 Tax=Linum tenue TaxID=586396 RepID=A0AAV0IHN4_9ROSI|nr:unnamed protein product [Linum tenue]
MRAMKEYAIVIRENVAAGGYSRKTEEGFRDVVDKMLDEFKEKAKDFGLEGGDKNIMHVRGIVELHHQEIEILHELLTAEEVVEMARQGEKHKSEDDEYLMKVIVMKVMKEYTMKDQRKCGGGSLLPKSGRRI